MLPTLASTDGQGDVKSGLAIVQLLAKNSVSGKVVSDESENCSSDVVKSSRWVCFLGSFGFCKTSKERKVWLTNREGRCRRR